MKKLLKICLQLFLWFYGIVFMLLFLLAPFILVSYIESVRTSGFATTDIWKSFIVILGLIIGISTLIPPFRKIYYKLPWLLSYAKIFYVNTIILSVALFIINYGYEVQNEARHTLFFILMWCEIIIGRILMCIYFSKKKVAYIGDDSNEQKL